GYILRQARVWHSVSAAIALAGLFGFAATGVTLNHAGVLQSAPRVETAELLLSPEAQEALAALPDEGSAPLPATVAAELGAASGLAWSGRAAELSDDEVYIALTRPGRDGYLAIDRSSGEGLIRR